MQHNPSHMWSLPNTSTNSHWTGQELIIPMAKTQKLLKDKQLREESDQTTSGNQHPEWNNVMETTIYYITVILQNTDPGPATTALHEGTTMTTLHEGQATALHEGPATTALHEGSATTALHEGPETLH